MWHGPVPNHDLPRTRVIVSISDRAIRRQTPLLSMSSFLQLPLWEGTPRLPNVCCEQSRCRRRRGSIGPRVTRRLGVFGAFLLLALVYPRYCVCTFSWFVWPKRLCMGKRTSVFDLPFPFPPKTDSLLCSHESHYMTHSFLCLFLFLATVDQIYYH